jgi:hypothetical protein
MSSITRKSTGGTAVPSVPTSKSAQMFGCCRLEMARASRCSHARRSGSSLDPLEWLARMRDRIPDPGQHRTLFNGEYSNRVRGSGHPDEREAHAGEAPEPRKRCSPTWARLIARVYQVDPLVCTRCGQRMSTIGFVTDQMAVQEVLDHIGLSSPEAAKPPPPGREVLRVAEHGDGCGTPQQREPA